jgi:Amt family ammonium transporter
MPDKPRLLWLLLSLASTPAMADTGLNAANTAWILTATALVLFMTLPGLSLFYGGLVRSKNVLSVLMQCFAITGMASIIWLLFGYSLAFGQGNAFIGDLHHIFLKPFMKTA